MRTLLVSFAVAFVLTHATASAQMSNGQEGEGFIGLAGQNDASLHESIRLSAVGLNFGFMVQPVFQRRRFAIVEQMSVFPVVEYNRAVGLSAPGATYDQERPLIVSVTQFRVGTEDPEVEHHLTWFAEAGGALVIATPRDGPRISPVGSVGVRLWFQRQFGLEASVQCAARELGRTRCILPISSLWPLR